MDQKTRTAVEAYHRLTETLRAAISDPDGYEAALSTAAHETNDAFTKAGLLGSSPGEIFALVRELHPDWHPT